MNEALSVELRAIGIVEAGGEGRVEGAAVRIETAYRPGLSGLEGFSHAIVVWIAHRLPPWDDAYALVDKPYRDAPARLGIFATRSPYRPNPICLSLMRVVAVDAVEGLVRGDWIDAEPGSPVLDLKPYHPSSDRPARPELPPWCSHWPKDIESGADFPWSEEFLF